MSPLDVLRQRVEAWRNDAEAAHIDTPRGDTLRFRLAGRIAAFNAVLDLIDEVASTTVGAAGSDPATDPAHSPAPVAPHTVETVGGDGPRTATHGRHPENDWQYIADMARSAAVKSEALARWKAEALPLLDRILDAAMAARDAGRIRVPYGSTLIEAAAQYLEGKGNP